MGADFYLLPEDGEWKGWEARAAAGLPDWRKTYAISAWVGENCPQWDPNDWHDMDSLVTGADLERLLAEAQKPGGGELGSDEAERVIEQLPLLFARPEYARTNRYRFVRSY